MTTSYHRSVLGGFALSVLVASFAAILPVTALADGIDGGYSGYIDNYPSGGGYSGYIDNGYNGGYSGYIDNGYNGGYSGYIDNGYNGGYSGYIDNGYDCSYYGDCGGYNDSSNYGGSYDCSYYGDCGGYNQSTYSGGYDCSYYGDCGGYNDYQPWSYSGGYTSTYSQPVYTYDYSYDYVYDYTYDYTYDNPTCADTGQQGHYPNCGRCNSEQTGTYPNCHNIVHECPAGQTGTYPNCHRPQDRQPVCDISASDNSIDDNDSTTLHWTSENATSATLSGFGSVSTGGSKTVSPNDDETYTLTVRDDDGDTDTCSTTVHVNQHHNSNISCDLNASDPRVSEGDRVTLDWDTSGDVTYASINEGVGRVDEDGGSERVTVDNDTTYRMTVRNSDGDEDTCSVTVRVDDNNFSSVTFTGEPTNNPPVVYLSDIPYTGLEDIDPILLSYWLMLIAGAGAGVWFLYRRGMIPHFAFASVEPIDEGHVEEVEEGHADAVPAPGVMSFLSALQNGDTDEALDYVRDAANTGTGVEEFLASAEVAATDADLQAKVSAALEASKVNGIRGAKEALI